MTTQPGTAKPGVVESVSALGLLTLGIGALALTGLATARDWLAAGFAGWLWLIPLWGLTAVILGWLTRRRAVAGRLRAAGRLWLALGAVPLVALMAFGRPLQKVMQEQQAARVAKPTE